MLGVSPVLLESYLTAAERDQRAGASATAKRRRSASCSACGRTRRRTGTSRGCRSGPSAALLIQPTLPLDGEYQFQVRLFRTNLGTMRGLEYPASARDLPSTAQRVHLASFGGDKEIAASSDNPTTTGDDVDGRFTVRVPLKAGPHEHHASRSSRRRTRSTRAGCRTTCAAPSDTIDFSGYPHIDEIILTGPFNPTGVGRHAEPAPHLRLPPEGRRRRRALRAPDSDDARRAAPIGAMSRHDDVPTAAGLLPARPSRRRELRRGHRSRAAPHAGQPEVPRSASNAIPRTVARGRGVSRSATSSSPRACRSSCGAAFPTTSCSTLAAKGRLHDAGRARSAGAADARRSEGRRRSSTTSSGQWLQLRNLRTKQPNSHEFPDFDDNLRQALGTETELFFALDHARGPQRARPDDGRLHVRQRAAGQALRHPERLRQPLPPRDADRRRRATGLLGQGRDADGDVAPAPHVAGAARQVDPREHARHAAAAAARRRAAVRGGDRRRPSRSRCASGWSSTAATRRARAATA